MEHSVNENYMLVCFYFKVIPWGILYRSVKMSENVMCKWKQHQHNSSCLSHLTVPFYHTLVLYPIQSAGSHFLAASHTHAYTCVFLWAHVCYCYAMSCVNVCVFTVQVCNCRTVVSEHGIGPLQWRCILVHVHFHVCSWGKEIVYWVVWEEGSRVKSPSLCDSDLLGVAGHCSSSTVEPAPPSGEGEWSSSSAADDLQWWPETLGECSSLCSVTLSPPLFHAGLSKLCSQCTVYM